MKMYENAKVMIFKLEERKESKNGEFPHRFHFNEMDRKGIVRFVFVVSFLRENYPIQKQLHMLSWRPKRK